MPDKNFLSWGEAIFCIIGLLCALWVLGPAHGHDTSHDESIDWYPPNCCHSLEVPGGDCGVAEIIQVVPEGRIVRQLKTGITVLVPELETDGKPNKRILVNTHDNLYHVCVRNDPESGLWLYCFFEPQGSYRARHHL